MDPIVLIPITVVFVVGLVVGRNELVKRKLTCPRQGETAEVDLLRRSLRPSKLVSVQRCSLLADPKKIDCGQECLRPTASHS